ncbi:MAG: hypothetical protein K2J66_03490, partial [Muribaculaceae bacterium]|nr:hypothetical protein [Muribaculaceae bacterium]
ECKGMHFLFTHQIFLQLFSGKFQQNIPETPQTHRNTLHPIQLHNPQKSSPHNAIFSPQTAGIT